MKIKNATYDALVEAVTEGDCFKNGCLEELLNRRLKRNQGKDCEGFEKRINKLQREYDLLKAEADKRKETTKKEATK